MAKEIPDPVVQPQVPVIQDYRVQTSQGSIDEILKESKESEEDFMKQADEAFDVLEKARTRPVTVRTSPGKKPAVGSDESKPVKTADPVTDKPVPTTQSKVPAPPVSISKSPSKPQEVVDDLPRDFVPGQIRGEQWKKLHQLRDDAVNRATEAEKKLVEFEAKLKESSSTPNNEIQKKYETLQTDYDKVLGQLESIAVERSPRFEAQFKPRIESAVALAKSSVGPDLSEKVATLLAMPDTEYRNSQLDEIANSLTGIRALKFGNAIAEIDRISQERQSIAERGRDIFKQWTQEQELSNRNQREAARAQVEKTFQNESKEWENVEFFAKKTDDNEHNSKVESRLQQARQIFDGGLTMQELARASFWAVLGPEAIADSRAKSSRISELEAELAKYQSANPGASSDAAGSIEETVESEDLDYSDAIAREVQKSGLMR